MIYCLCILMTVLPMHESELINPMALTQVSVIIPMRNMAKEIESILRSTAEQINNCLIELVIVDMGSSDGSVLTALSVIKELKLSGCVVQNGNGKLGMAFNTGIYKAAGEYVTFLFPHRLYRDYIQGYYTTGKEHNADIVFGTAASAVNTIFEDISAKGTDMVLDIIHSKANIDIGAIMLKREFLLNNQIRFCEDCSFGFSEEFILRALLYTNSVCQSTTVMRRDKINEIPGRAINHVGNLCFEKVSAMQRIYEVVKYRHKGNRKLQDAFVYEKLPDTVLSCVDIMLNEGLGYNAIRGAIKLKGYDDLLVSSKSTGALLHKNILVWKMIPWMYQSRIR